MNTRIEGIRKNERTKAKLIIYGELAFVIIPFVFLFFIHLQRNSITDFWKIHDWSIAATILSGQTSVRFISGLTKHKVKNWQLSLIYQVLIISLVLMCFFDFIILEVVTNPSIIFAIIQYPLFLLSVYLYIVFGSVGQIFLDLNRRKY